MCFSHITKYDNNLSPADVFKIISFHESHYVSLAFTSFPMAICHLLIFVPREQSPLPWKPDVDGLQLPKSFTISITASHTVQLDCLSKFDRHRRLREILFCLAITALGCIMISA